MTAQLKHCPPPPSGLKPHPPTRAQPHPSSHANLQHGLHGVVELLLVCTRAERVSDHRRRLAVEDRDDLRTERKTEGGERERERERKVWGNGRERRGGWRDRWKKADGQTSGGGREEGKGSGKGNGIGEEEREAVSVYNKTKLN